MPLAGEAVDDEVLSLHVAEPPQLHEELAKEQIRARFGHKGDGRCRGDHGNPIRLTLLPDAVRWLRCSSSERRSKENRTRASEERPPGYHSSTSSARPSSDGG